MPNFASIFDMRSTPGDTASAMTRMSRVLDVPGLDFVTGKWSDSRFGAVNLLNGICGNLDQPAIDDRGGVLFLDGEISNLNELFSAREKDRLPPPASVCLGLFRRHGEEFVRLLNGHFNVMIYEARSGSLTIFNDRLGYRPLYYHCADGLSVVANEKKAIFAALERTPPLDHAGVLEFMTFGHNLDDRTIFAGIRAVRQGTILKIKNGGIVERQYWAPEYRKRSGSGSIDDAATELGGHIINAVSRKTQIDRRYGLFLSGGLDSRAIAGAMARTTRCITSYTFGEDDSPDLEYGRQLADAFGFGQRRLSYRDISLGEYLPKVVWRTEGAVPFNQTISIAQHRHIRRESDVIFNGHFGDAISGGHLLPGLFLLRHTGDLAQHILRKRALIQMSTLRKLIKPEFMEDAHAGMVDGIEKSLDAFDESSLPLRFSLWDMTVRQPRFTFCSSPVDRYVVEPIAPFTDNDVVDCMLNFPIRWLFGQRVYKRAIVRAFPEAARIPWAKTRRPISTNFISDLSVLSAHYVSSRLRSTGKAVAPSDGDPRLLSLETAVGDDARWDSLPSEIFDRESVRSMAHDAVRGRVFAAPLFLLLTLSETVRLLTSGCLTGMPSDAVPPL